MKTRTCGFALAFALCEWMAATAPALGQGRAVLRPDASRPVAARPRPPITIPPHAPLTSLVRGPGLPSHRFAPRVGVLAGMPLLLVGEPAWWIAPDTDDGQPMADVGRAQVPTPPAEYSESSSIQPPFARPHATAPSSTGTLRVDVAPPGAQLYVDGFYAAAIDALPKQELALSAGWHRVELRAPGFETRALNVTIEANRTSTVHVGMRPRF